MAVYFLRALARISSATWSPIQRSRRIRRAAYASMALAAGPRRAWSQALLRSLRSRARLRPPRSRRVLLRRHIGASAARMRDPSRTDVLRSLVPGGNAMDLCSLLEETANYVQCLGAQVRLMQAVVDAVAAGDPKLITNNCTAPKK